MIIVLLLLFQSLCLYCQRLVLHVHDRWINRTNARLLVEVAETVGDRKALQHLQQQQIEQAKRQNKRRLLEPYLPLGAAVNAEGPTCRFCANTPQGYCRHHFHLQELQLHKQQQRHQYPPLAANKTSGIGQEYRQLRRIKRELKRSLHQQQRFSTQPQQLSSQQFHHRTQEQQQEFEEDELSLASSHTSLSSGFISCSTNFEEELEEQPELTSMPMVRTHIVTSYL